MTDTPGGETIAAEWFPAKQLVPWDRNYLMHPESQLRLIGRSIARNGWGSACVAQSGTRRLIVGHGRVASFLALMDAGERFDQVPEEEERKRLRAGLIPVRWRDIDDSRAAEMAIADNESARKAVRDDDLLESVVRDLTAETERSELALGLDDKDYKLLLGDDDVTPAPSELGTMIHGVLVMVDGEEDQAKAIAEIEDLGYKCEPIIQPDRG